MKKLLFHKKKTSSDETFCFEILATTVLSYKTALCLEFRSFFYYYFSNPHWHLLYFPYVASYLFTVD